MTCLTAPRIRLSTKVAGGKKSGAPAVGGRRRPSSATVINREWSSAAEGQGSAFRRADCQPSARYSWWDAAAASCGVASMIQLRSLSSLRMPITAIDISLISLLIALVTCPLWVLSPLRGCSGRAAGCGVPGRAVRLIISDNLQSHWRKHLVQGTAVTSLQGSRCVHLSWRQPSAGTSRQVYATGGA